jgi:hypothetical protein
MNKNEEEKKTKIMQKKTHKKGRKMNEKLLP